jgi:hypothetical protein
MKHRHLEYPENIPVLELGLAAIDDLLDRGTLVDWAPLARAIADDPWGRLAENVLDILAAHDMYGTGALWRRYIQACHSRCQPGWPTHAPLGQVRRLRAKTQAEVGRAMGMNQSEVSRFERRNDVLVSHLTRYAQGTKGQLRLLIAYPDAPAVELQLPSSSVVPPR